MQVALYGRVSTDGQSVNAQLAELREVAERRGWEIVHEYTDKGISGAKGRDQRPALDAILKAATRGEVDMVAAWSVDRLGRSLQHLVAGLADLQASGVGLYLHKQALDTSTPSGRAMFGMLAIFAEFERELIQERVRAGMKVAKAEQAAGQERLHPNRRRKKAICRPRVLPETEAKIRAKYSEDKGKGMTAISKALRVGDGTVKRVIDVSST